jgi:hypothetical protein
MLPAPLTPDVYTGPGFQFRYPSGWTIEEERTDDQFTVSVFPDSEEGTTAWSVTLLFDRPAPQSAVRAVLRAYESEYDDLDSYPADEQISGRKAVGRDLEFLCLELTNSAGVRAFRTKDFTAMVIFQATDNELDTVLPSFRMMTGSLQCGWEGGNED